MKVSYILITYNHEKYILDCLEGFFGQQGVDELNIEYIISDDNSSDNTVMLVEEYLRKNEKHLPENVVFLKSDINRGVIEHFNMLIRSSTGDIIIPGAGDDINRPNRVAAIVDAMVTHNVTMVSSDAIIIDQNGKMLSRLFLKPKIAPTLDQIFRYGSVFIPGAGNAYHREIFDKFGPLPENIENEDDQWPVRALLLRGIFVINEPIFYYRMHSASLSAWLWNSSSTLAKNVERYRINLTNRVNHYREWMRLINIAHEKINIYSLNRLNDRVNMYEQIHNDFFSWNRLYCLKYIRVASFGDVGVVLFGAYGVQLKVYINKLKAMVKRFIF
jgi:glycosyltransferase involved in cell wall biosynthesis